MVSPAAAITTRQLREQGQSVWLDYISRALIGSGQLSRMIDDGWITGMTSNPTIFEKAITGSADYDAAIRAIAAAEPVSPYDAFVALATEDIRAAADALRPVYDASGGWDGYVSLEVPPGSEHDVSATVAEALRLRALVDRPNLMIKIPGTPAGAEALEEAIVAGVNVNQTLLFAIEAYERAAGAYIRGLERRLEAGQPVAGIASVASFFVSRLDTAVDALLPEGSALRGRAAVANARLAYRRFMDIFAGPRWERLAAAGARVQRPLWASTGTKNPTYSDVLYVEELIAPETVNTLPESTLRAVLDHACVAPSIMPHIPDAERTMRALMDTRIDIVQVTDRLLVEGLASFERDFRSLLDSLESRLALARTGGPGIAINLGSLPPRVEARLEAIDREQVTARILQGDHTVWKPGPTEITNRLGWISVIDTMVERVDELDAFAGGVASEGYTRAVLLGMGGSSLAPEVLHAILGSAPGMLDLTVLDTTNPAQILRISGELDLERAIFIVSSKSGSTIETVSQFAYFWDKIPDGRHFVAITDPGSGLELLARDRGFREVFLNPADIGGRYSALSYFGLVPAALMGIDLRRLLEGAAEMRAACHSRVPARDNPGAWLGAAIGEASLAGRDKLTLALPPPVAALGCWIEQLIAESTGKEGRGILPVDRETLGQAACYGDDRLFAGIADDPALALLESAGLPIACLPRPAAYRLGGEFFRWEFATAIAGHILAVNPFDQPNVEEAKDAARRILAGARVDTSTPSLDHVLEQVRPGDYIAILAYLDRDPGNEDRLTSVRLALRNRFRVATTVGFGPRYLHSTGQLHKGGPNTGVFLQVVDGGGLDVPIPGKGYTFGDLHRAQADGDLAALKDRGRRVARVTLDELAEACR